MIECHFCGVVYVLRGWRATWHMVWQELTEAGWVQDEQRHWKCDTCQKEEGENNG